MTSLYIPTEWHKAQDYVPTYPPNYTPYNTPRIPSGARVVVKEQVSPINTYPIGWEFARTRR